MEIGERLRELRIQRGLTQEELADRCELSKGFISQVERELASPSIATLKDMLECLGVTLQSFFSDDSAEKVVFAPQDMFEKEDEESGHKITWLVPDAQKNSMEPHPAGAVARRQKSGASSAGKRGIWLCAARTGHSGGGQAQLHGKKGRQLLSASQRHALSGKRECPTRRRAVGFYTAQLLISILKRRRTRP